MRPLRNNLARAMRRRAGQEPVRGKQMIEMLVSGFVLTGSVCAMDGDLFRNCREIPAAQFGNKYACDQRVESILTGFPHVRPERLGYPEGQRLRVQVECTPSGGRA